MKKIDIQIHIQVCPILLYSAENWVMTESTRGRIQAIEMKYLRRVKGITRLDKICNEYIRNELEIEPASKKIEK